MRGEDGKNAAAVALAEAMSAKRRKEIAKKSVKPVGRKAKPPFFQGLLHKTASCLASLLVA